jgi:hypothetical protein
VFFDLEPSDAYRMLKSCYGVVSLHVGRVRDMNLSLDVVPDSEHHANIQGAPYPEDDPELAEAIASRLVGHARRVLDRKGDPVI